MLILLSVIIFALVQVQKLESNIKSIDRTNDLIISLENLVLNLSESESFTLGYLLTNNNFFVERNNISMQLIKGDLDLIEKLTNVEFKENAKYVRIRELTTEKISIQNKTISLKDSNNLSNERMISNFNLGRLYLEEIKRIKGEIESEETLVLTKREELSGQNITYAIYGILFSFFVAFGIGIFVVLYLLKHIKMEETMKKGLEEINENKNRFFSIISHDLRGPVNNILALSGILQEEGSESKKKQMITMIDTSIKKLNHLLNNLLQWASIQMSSSSKIFPELVYPVELVKDNFEIFIPIASGKNITLVNKIPQEATIWADRNMINTVFRNLISNAIKYTRRNGEVVISSILTGYFLEISVKDNGVGMSEDVVSNLFKKSTKHSTPGTENEMGSGLGLQICKEFVEKNGGEISAESKINHGTVFNFKLYSKCPVSS